MYLCYCTGASHEIVLAETAQNDGCMCPQPPSTTMKCRKLTDSFSKACQKYLEEKLEPVFAIQQAKHGTFHLTMCQSLGTSLDRSRFSQLFLKPLSMNDKRNLVIEPPLWTSCSLNKSRIIRGQRSHKSNTLHERTSI